MAEQAQQVQPRDFNLVVTAYSVINRRDTRALTSLMAPDGVIETRIETHSGREEIESMYREAFSSDFTIGQEAFVIDDGRIHSLTTLSIVGGLTGIESTEPLLETWIVSDGLVQSTKVMDRTDGVELFRLADALATLERTRTIYDDFAKEGFASIGPQLSPDVAVDLSAHLLDEQPVTGKQQAGEYFVAFDKMWDSFEMSPTRMIAAGDLVLTEVQAQATGGGSGAAVNETVTHLFEFENGLLRRFELHSDSEAPLDKLCASA